MKRNFIILITLALPLLFGACALESAAAGLPFAGKIAIITGSDAASLEYETARQVVKKYGARKILHLTWPVNYAAEQEGMIVLAEQIAANRKVKALIINPAAAGAGAVLEKLRETRDDIFVICDMPLADPTELINQADLVLMEDELTIGPAMARQAHKLGAKTLVHYSFPRHMAWAEDRCALIKAECAKLGLEFVYADAPDPQSGADTSAAEQFILEDVPRQVAEYGRDTAFFCTHISLQAALIKAVLDNGAIFPQPCVWPSPNNGFTSALGLEHIDGGLSTVKYIISNTASIIKDKGLLGRVSTWPAPTSYLIIEAGAAYAVKWIKGEVPPQGIDMAALRQCMEDCAGVECFIRVYEDEDGTEYPNFLLLREEYLTYGDEHIIKE